MVRCLDGNSKPSYTPYDALFLDLLISNSFEDASLKKKKKKNGIQVLNLSKNMELSHFLNIKVEDAH